MKDKKEKKEKTKFNLAFDNLAIPEVHIGGNAAWSRQCGT